jgi:hypothetical protein
MARDKKFCKLLVVFKGTAEFFEKRERGGNSLPPLTPFLPAPPERFGILRNAAGRSNFTLPPLGG